VAIQGEGYFSGNIFIVTKETNKEIKEDTEKERSM